MNEEFFQQIHRKQNQITAVPSNEEVSDWAINLLNLLYPERLTTPDYSVNEIKRLFLKLEKELIMIFNATNALENCDNEEYAKKFFEGVPELYRKMNNDITAIYLGDPAAQSEFEVIRVYPGFLGIALYRIANDLLKAGIPIIPRILTEYAHSVTGIDIHPAATIGEHLFIDHGTGVVIGETTVIGNHVKLYQGVTLGALSVEKDRANTKRHPTIGNHVIIYSGATILGGETIIGDSCIIGGNVWLTKSIPDHSTVYHQSTIKVVETKKIG
ncbi:MAG: serine acetyltransferase [Pedobacter sp.]|nr:serine acetyltransferase [Pedobacter sp.]